MNRRLAVAVATSFLFSSAVFAQGNPQGGTPSTGGGQFPSGNRATSNGPRPYSEVITSKAKTSKGLLVTHRVDDKFYFEIPDSLLNREILVVNRISKAPAGARADLGRAGALGRCDYGVHGRSRHLYEARLLQRSALASAGRTRWRAAHGASARCSRARCTRGGEIRRAGIELARGAWRSRSKPRFPIRG